MLAWRELENLIGKANRVLLTTHDRPDGDGLGSELALADLLAQKGKEVEIYNPSPIPSRYRFLDPDGTKIFGLEQGEGSPRTKPDLLIVLDTGAWSQLADLAGYVRQLEAEKVVIDHHVSQDDLGALQLVDTSASACGMLIYEAFEQFDGELTEASAEALFVAIAMDTGWIRHQNATSEVFGVLSKLVANGAKPAELYRQLFETNSLARMRLLAIMLGRLDLSMDGRLASCHLLQTDISEAGAHPMDTEDFITFPMSLQGVETAILFIEQKGGGTKVSFRSRSGLDCSRLAEQFGGGGHKPAAGATLSIPIEQARKEVLSAAELAMRKSGSVQ